jgi:membrane protein required for beta-lactamase induction
MAQEYLAFAFWLAIIGAVALLAEAHHKVAKGSYKAKQDF